MAADISFWGNVFINIFYFVIIEPEDITNKSWIEYTDNFNDYEIDGIYDGLMNNKTGEVTLQWQRNLILYLM